MGAGFRSLVLQPIRTHTFAAVTHVRPRVRPGSLYESLDAAEDSNGSGTGLVLPSTG